MNGFEYGSLSIDFKTRRIVANGREFSLDPKAFDTLVVLIRHRDRIVSNDELIKKVWSNRPTGNEVVTASVGRVRKVFKEAGIEGVVIRTTPKVGYQFMLEPHVDSGLGKEKQAVPSQPQNNSLRALIATNIILFATLAIALFTLWVTHYKDQGQDHRAIKNLKTIWTDSDQLSTGEKHKATEIFFIRHADTQADGTNDPPLSALGERRAQHWRAFFSHINFDAIYTTEFRRSTQTVERVFVDSSNIVEVYGALSFDIAKEVSGFAGKKIAIVGHSNTIPGMVNRLFSDFEFDAMDHGEYELIYHLTIDSSGGVSVNPLRLNYELVEEQQ